MVRLEVESRKRTRKRNIQKIILGSIAAAGLLGVVVLAPNVIGAMGKVGLLPSRRQGEFIQASRNRLIKRGLVAYEGKKLRLTPAGERYLRGVTLRDHTIAKPKRWDRKWRVLIFDIPERRKTLRNNVRSILINIGFVRLQDSVWIYPYDCEDLIVMLKADFRIGKDLLYMVVDALEYDAVLKKRFNVH